MRARSFALALLLAAAACGGRAHTRTYPEPGSTALLAHLRGTTARIGSLRAETKSDARVGDERANVTVLILAASGGKLRFLALNPNDSTASDLASDGQTYCLLDAHANCGECGPATPERVGRLLRIVLAPDEIVAVLFGGTPLLVDAAAQSTWDAKNGQEILTLARDGMRQTVILDGKDRRWDVLESKLVDAQGKLIWKIRHKDFGPRVTATGGTVRLPAKSMFEDGRDSVLIRWKDQEPGVAIDDARFRLELPAGLPACSPPE